MSWKAQTCQNYQMISCWKYARVAAVSRRTALLSLTLQQTIPCPRVGVDTARGTTKLYNIPTRTFTFYAYKILGQLSASA